jgi:hypothetical protein
MLKRSLLAIVVSFFFVGTALAAPMTWTDTIDFNPDVMVGWYSGYSYTHDITDDGFTPLQDFVYDYSLEVALYDDGGCWDFGEIAFINQPGLLGDGFYNFNYENVDLGWSLVGLVELNLLGGLDVTIESWGGDFYLDYSILTANGCDNAPVPEPSTLLLLGAGVAGLAFYRRKKNA